MSVNTLIRAAMDAGVSLKFEDGKLKALGHADAVRTWAPRLRQHKAELIEALQPRESATDWRVIDHAYQIHHFRCSACIAAGKGYGRRCPILNHSESSPVYVPLRKFLKPASDSNLLL